MILFQFSGSETARVENIALYETSETANIKNGVIYVKPETDVKLWLFGSELDSTEISFSKVAKPVDTPCDSDRTTDPLKVATTDVNKANVALNFKVAAVTFYLCVKDNETSQWKHQGEGPTMKIIVEKKTFALPLWFSITLIAILMMLSGLFSGLNLGLMSLDPNELKIVSNSGTARQKKYAKKIMPVRKHGNFLLCTLLLGNTLVNSSFTILLDGLTGGIVAIIGSTLAIVIMGEIVPQSICSRYGLAVGAYTIYLTKLFMILTFPLSFPVSKLLDCILGKELGNVYNKQQLLEMLKLQSEYNDLEQDEVGIISGALKYKSKTVAEVMTQLEDCFLLDEEAILDFQTMSSIIRTGYSRIPIYSNERSNIVALLFVKDLAFVDPDDCIPLLSVIKFYNHRVHKVFFDTTLDKMLEEFKQGTSHLAVVLKINDSGDGDPFYESTGIVTLEDIIEEIIQAEIVDETDVYVDNVSGQKVHRKHHNQDFTLFLPSPEDAQPKLSSQLVFAIFQYLSTAVSVFTGELISRSVLKKLIEHPGVVEEKEVTPEKDEKGVYLYKKGSHTDFFALILQGRVEVTVGDENIVFEDGPFSVFGIKALTNESGSQYMPDFTVKILSTLQFLKISRSLYRSAVRATKMERENRTPENYHEFDEIFWKNIQNNDVLSHKSDVSSLKSMGSEKSTPNRTEQNKNHKNSLLRRLTPKRERKRDSNEQGRDSRTESHKIGTPSPTFVDKQALVTAEEGDATTSSNEFDNTRV